MGTAQGAPGESICCSCAGGLGEPNEIPDQCESSVVVGLNRVGTAEQDEEIHVKAYRTSSFLDGGSLDGDEEAEEAPPDDDSGRRRSRVSIVDLHAVTDASSRRMSDKPKPDFSGEWKMVRCEGDFDSFMKEVGVGWAMRKAAGAVGYGVNATYHSIKCTADDIVVETKNPKGTFVRRFRIDGSEQDDEDPVQKKPIKVIPYWEDVADRTTLTLQAFMPVGQGDPVKMPATRRYLESSGASMVVEQTSPEGVVVKRFFVPL